MIKEFYGLIKVDKAIKPLPFAKRQQPDLKVGRDYFVSYLNNNAYPCIVLEIINEFDHEEVRIEIPLKISSKRHISGSSGRVNYRPVHTDIVRAVQIGLTPEDAVRNQA